MPRLLLVLGLLALLAPARALAGGEASIFYYPWYGTPQRDGGYLHWDQGGHVPPLDLASSYYPARGPYSGADPAVVGAQMRQIAGAGIREVVSSWWGWGSIEDARLPIVVRMAQKQGLSVAVQIEPYPGRSAASVASDLSRLFSLGITRFYVYHPFDIDKASWAPLLTGLADVQVFAQTANVSAAQAAHFTGVYTYDVFRYGAAAFGRLCARAHRAGLLCAPSVGPGYDALRATGDTHLRPRRDGATYDGMWRAAIYAGADRVTITSFNEWHEGTQIEPAATPSQRRLATARGPSTSPVVEPYSSYDGAYGLHGKAASRAYLARTAYWATLYRAGKDTAQGRKAAFRPERDPVATTTAAASSTVSSGSKGSPGAVIRGFRSNLLLEALASRLMPAVRVTGSDTVARPLGRAALGTARAGRVSSCYRALCPLALLGMSAITRCASSTRDPRSTCTRRTASTTASYWGKARRSKGG